MPILNYGFPCLFDTSCAPGGTAEIRLHCSRISHYSSETSDAELEPFSYCDGCGF